MHSRPQRLIGPHLPLGAGPAQGRRPGDGDRRHGRPDIHRQPDRLAPRRRAPAKLAAFRERLAEAGIGPIAVHAPYLINLCGGNEDFWHKSIATVANELRVGATTARRSSSCTSARTAASIATREYARLVAGIGQVSWPTSCSRARAAELG